MLTATSMAAQEPPVLESKIVSSSVEPASVKKIPSLAPNARLRSLTSGMGIIQIEILIDTAGSITQVTWKAGFEGLKAEALSWVQSLQFEPSSINEKSSPSRLTIAFRTNPKTGQLQFTTWFRQPADSNAWQYIPVA
jgi:outer membrane biosynthesis protein TonB